MAENHVTNFCAEEPVTPVEEDFGNCNHLDEHFENEHGMRKSLSMSDIPTFLNECMLSSELQNDKDEVYKGFMNRTPQDLSRTKFGSMAELPKLQFRTNCGKGPSALTIPQSPTLRCRLRSRRHHVLSQKEKEEAEIEEMKKFKLRANPVPKVVIEGSKNLPKVPKRPGTVPEPFKLTKIHKKSQQIPEVPPFRARPAPKHILEKPVLPPKPALEVTNSDDISKILKDLPINQQFTENRPKKVQRHGPILVQAFSFEKRDAEKKRLREEKIKQQIEEGRKQAYQFKARPLPGVAMKPIRSASVKYGTATTSSENKENVVKFEAHSATVLHKETSKPKKLAPFTLATEQRAVEREKFDKQRRDKEQAQEHAMKLKKKEELEEFQRKTTALRAQLIHHPIPVPSSIADPFVPEKSDVPLTVPETPKFIRRMRQTFNQYRY